MKEFIVKLWELRKQKYTAITHVLAPTLTPRGGIWVREVLVHWGMVRMKRCYSAVAFAVALIECGTYSRVLSIQGHSHSCQWSENEILPPLPKGTSLPFLGISIVFSIKLPDHEPRIKTRDF